MSRIKSLFVIGLQFLRIVKMCDCNPQSLDLKTPRNVYLTAFYKRSFAYHTVKNRMPVILTKTIDGLVRAKEDIGKEYGKEGQEDLKLVIGELSKLKYEIQTNKPLRKLTSNASDVEFYNNYITSQFAIEGNVTYFSAIWLLTECYMYRRIKESFELTNTLKDYDPFLKQKRDAYYNALPIMSKLAEYLLEFMEQSAEPKKEEFIRLLKINLWGNKCDLSLSNGKMTEDITDLFNLENLEPNILCDHSEKIWGTIAQGNSSIIDIVFDNSGYEVFTDLCLADYLITKHLASQIRLYVKTVPWFISDVMIHDFNWTLQQLKNNNSDQFLKKLGKRWTNYVKNKTWVLIEDDFWTLPIDYSLMSKVKPSLYKQLSEAALVIFKGDLNYRKLFGEKNWDPTTPVDEALQNFNPTKLCSLRTIKADIVCGLDQGVAEKTEAVSAQWMETGDYGLIQFSDKIVPI